jgi:hypothetical protein
VSDDAFFVYDEGRARGEAAFLVEYAVIFRYLAFEIAEEREGDSDVFGEALIGGEAVNTDAQDLRVACVEFGNISLICLQLSRSASGEGQHVEGEDDVLLAFKIAELDGLARRIRQREIGRGIAHFQMRLGRGRLLRERERRKREQ